MKSIDELAFRAETFATIFRAVSSLPPKEAQRVLEECAASVAGLGVEPKAFTPLPKEPREWVKPVDAPITRQAFGYGGGGEKLGVTGPAPLVKNKRKNTPGAGLEMLRAFLKGPHNYDQLSHALNWERHRTSVMLSFLASKSYLERADPEQVKRPFTWRLSPLGRAQIENGSVATNGTATSNGASMAPEMKSLIA